MLATLYVIYKHETKPVLSKKLKRDFLHGRKKFNTQGDANYSTDTLSDTNASRSYSTRMTRVEDKMKYDFAILASRKIIFRRKGHANFSDATGHTSTSCCAASPWPQ